MKNILFLLFIFAPVFCFSQQQEDTVRTFAMKEGDTTYTMKRYYLCIYLSGPNRTQSKQKADSIQAAHLTHINTMSEKGVICMAGPFGDKTDKRGILIFDVATQKEAEEWIKKDPAVVAGRLLFEIHPWWSAVGSKLK